MLFEKTPYLLSMATNIPLTSASSLKILYVGSRSDKGEWAATASGNNAVTMLSESSTLQGTYKLQVVAIIDGVTRRSDIVVVTFSKALG